MLRLKLINYYKRLRDGAIGFSYGASDALVTAKKKAGGRMRIFESNTLRYVFTKVTGNFFFKLLLAAVLFLAIITTSVLYFERNYVAYKIVDGKRVEDTSRKSNITSLRDAIWWDLRHRDDHGLRGLLPGIVGRALFRDTAHVLRHRAGRRRHR